MASAVFLPTNEDHLARIDTQVDDRHGWGFALLLATTATLFLRPADLIPSLEKWPIYQALILLCIFVSARAAVRQLSLNKLVARPVTVSLLALLIAVGMSHLSHGFVWGARQSMLDVGKLLALYGLITALVNTPERLSLFIKWLTIAITTMAALALLDRFGYWSIAALESIRDRGVMEDGLATHIQRIRGTGIFQDPNDFGLILVLGIILCASLLFRPRVGLIRYGWCFPACVLLGTLALTYSRGALLSLMCAIPAALCYFRGGKYAVLPMLALPLVAIAFSSRMTDISAISSGTGQDRLQIWSASIEVFRQYPLFGLGEGLIADEIGVVTHNSFLHCFAELGFLGGTAFVSCFLAAGLGLWSWRQPNPIFTTKHDKESGASANSNRTEFTRQNGYLFAALAACVVAMLTISRQFVAPTYLILGLVSAAHSIATCETYGSDVVVGPRIGNRFLVVSVLVSVATLMVCYVTVRIFVRW